MASIVLPEGIQLLSGVEANRASVIPDVAEPLIATDTGKLYYGDNATAGGLPIQVGVENGVPDDFVSKASGGQFDAGVTVAGDLVVAAATGAPRIAVEGQFPTHRLLDTDATSGIRAFFSQNSNGRWTFFSGTDAYGVATNGRTMRLLHGAGVEIGEPTGTAPSYGQINAKGFFKDGVEIGGGITTAQSAAIVANTAAVANNASAIAAIPSNYLVNDADDTMVGNLTVEPASGLGILGVKGTSAEVRLVDSNQAAGSTTQRLLKSGDSLYLTSATDAGAHSTNPLNVRVYHEGGVQLGAAPGGDPGYAGINASKYEIDGVDITTMWAPLSGADFTGPVTSTQTGAQNTMVVEGDVAAISLRDTSAPANQKRFGLVSTGGQFNIQGFNDSGSATGTPITLTHAGGVQIGSPGGGDKGAQTLNVQGVMYQNNVAVQTTSDERLKTDIKPLEFSWGKVEALAGATASFEWKAPDEHHGEPGEGWVAQYLERNGFHDYVITDSQPDGTEVKRIDKAIVPILAQCVLALNDVNGRVSALEDSQ